MQGAPAALKKACWAATRSFSTSISPSSSRPENQPPQTEIPYFCRIGPSSAISIGKRRPVSMPVKPATEACRRHSSRLTSSDSSARSSFHHAIGAIPSFAFISDSHALLGANCNLAFPRGIHAGAIRALRPDPRLFQIGKAFALPRQRAHRFRMFDEIDVQRGGAVGDAAILQQVVETGNALELLQARDHGIAAVVADHDDHLVTGQHGGIDVRVHHHIGAVAEHDDGRAARATGAALGHGMAPASGDLVAHAGESEFAVKGMRVFYPPRPLVISPGVPPAAPIRVSLGRAVLFITPMTWA